MEASPALNQEEFLSRIVEIIESGDVIPVLGPGVITYGPDDKPLYPWLLDELAKDFNLKETPPTLHALVCMLGGTRFETKVRLKIKSHLQKLREMEPKPSPLLQALARLPKCRTFFTLGCDPLFEQALAFCHPGAGKDSPLVWNAYKDAGRDLPQSTETSPVLGYLFGSTDSTNPGSYNLWDADALEFAFSLHDMMRDPESYPRLVETFSSSSDIQDEKSPHPSEKFLGKHLLFLGANMSDWALRFILRILRKKKLSQSTAQELFLTELNDGRGDDPVAFFSAVSNEIHFQHCEKSEDLTGFARRLCDKVRHLAPPEPEAPNPSETTDAHKGEEHGKNAAFISYDHRDAEAALRIASALEKAKCKVWLDKDRLVAGDPVNGKIDRALSHTNCRLFISVISDHSESKKSGYLVRERDIAVDAARYFGNSTYYVPIVISKGVGCEPKNEPSFFWNPNSQRGVATLIEALDGHLSDSDAEKIARKLHQNQLP